MKISIFINMLEPSNIYCIASITLDVCLVWYCPGVIWHPSPTTSQSEARVTMSWPMRGKKTVDMNTTQSVICHVSHYKSLVLNWLTSCFSKIQRQKSNEVYSVEASTNKFFHKCGKIIFHKTVHFCV